MVEGLPVEKPRGQPTPWYKGAYMTNPLTFNHKQKINISFFRAFRVFRG
jgi:hypothetical protein